MNGSEIFFCSQANVRCSYDRSNVKYSRNRQIFKFRSLIYKTVKRSDIKFPPVRFLLNSAQGDSYADVTWSNICDV